MVTQKQKDDWMDEHVTLNGEPAKISGRLMPYATVYALTGSDRGYISAKFSWLAVHVITLKGGNFHA